MPSLNEKRERSAITATPFCSMMILLLLCCLPPLQRVNEGTGITFGEIGELDPELLKAGLVQSLGIQPYFRADGHNVRELLIGEPLIV